MNTENKLKVRVCDQEYSLVTDDDPAYVAQIAARLDREIRAVIRGSHGYSLQSASVVCALNALDEQRKSEESIDNMRGQIKTYVTEIGKLRAVKEKQAEKIKESEARIAALEKELAELKAKLSEKPEEKSAEKAEEKSSEKKEDKPEEKSSDKEKTEVKSSDKEKTEVKSSEKEKAEEKSSDKEKTEVKSSDKEKTEVKSSDKEKTEEKSSDKKEENTEVKNSDNKEEKTEAKVSDKKEATESDIPTDPKNGGKSAEEGCVSSRTGENKKEKTQEKAGTDRGTNEPDNLSRDGRKTPLNGRVPQGDNVKGNSRG